MYPMIHMRRNIPKPLVQHPVISALIGFNLQMASLRVATQTRDALARFEISPAKATALSLLRMNPGCDQSALGRALLVNRASAMKLVNSLSASGLVERKPGRNLRSKALYLTDAGERLLDAILPCIEQVDALAVDELVPAQRETLRCILAQLAKLDGDEKPLEDSAASMALSGKG
jgi:DNA-binding MarR family transcriptional regulator